MKLEAEKLLRIVSPVAMALKRYLMFIAIIGIGGLYAFLILHISQLTQVEADELEVLEMLQTTTRPQIDQRAVERILELQDQNVQVEALFQEARENPFFEQEDREE